MAALGRSRRPRPAPAERSTDLDAAREAALKLLDRARRTRSDLARRLDERGFAAATIAEALDRLAGVGLVDDAEYARAFLRSRGARRPAGRRRLEQELRARGVAAADVTAAFEREGGAADQAGGAARVVALAARRYRGLEPRLRRQRLYALLVRRGFDRDAIEAALAAVRGPDEPERE
jgi:regulatory protein